jgi:hypothetical protein
VSAPLIRALEVQARLLREEAAVLTEHGTDPGTPERTPGLLNVIAGEFEQVARKAQGMPPEPSQPARPDRPHRQRGERGWDG